MIRNKISLENIAAKGSSSLMQKDLQLGSGDYPIYGASGLLGYVDFYHQESESVGIVKDGAGVGRAYLLPAKSSCIGTMQYIIPKVGVDAHFLFYALENMNLSRYNTGATIPHIYFRDYKSEKIPEYSFEEQKELANTLDKLRKNIEKRQKQLEKLDLLVKSQFIEMFGDPVKNPKCWIVNRLSEHLEVIGGYAFKSDNFKEKGIPVLRIGNINSGTFLPNNLVFWEYDVTLEKYIMKPGDIVISLTGTVGKDDYANVCILGNDYERYYLNQRNAQLKLGESMNRLFIAQLLKFPKIKSRLTGISRGVRQANVANRDILNLAVPVPPIELQNEFARFVEQTDKSKFRIKQSLEKLEICYKSLLQKYFG